LNVIHSCVRNILRRSGDEQFESIASHRQLPDATERSDDADNVVLLTLSHQSTGVSAAKQAVGHGQDLMQQLQKTVRDEMRRVVEV